MRSRQGFASLIAIVFLSLGLTACGPSPMAVAEEHLLDHDYPRLANYFLSDHLTEEEARALARYDVLVLGLENQVANPEMLKLIRTLNPSVVMLCYIAANEYPVKMQTVPPWDALWTSLTNDDWLWMPDGQHVQFWQGCWSYNLTRRATAKKLVEFAVTAPDASLWDGVYWDNIWKEVTWYADGNVDSDRDGHRDMMKEFSRRWVMNEEALLGLTRLRHGHDAIIIANEGGENIGHWVANGRLFEGFPNTLPSIDAIMRNYTGFVENAYPPAVVIINANGDSTAVGLMRYGFYFTLMSDGYYAYDTGPSYHHNLWWYPEFDMQLGSPRGPAIKELGVWIREFDAGLVLFNAGVIPASIGLDFAGRPHDVTVPGQEGLILKR